MPRKPRVGTAWCKTTDHMDRDHLQATTVAKKLRPGQEGTRRVQARHGDALVCVRYRHDRLKLYRYTTVELVVDEGPLHPTAFDRAVFGLSIGRKETELQQTIKAAGGRWDPSDRLWWLQGSKIRKLGIVHRITRT
jgi:hypothetical protein